MDLNQLELDVEAHVRKVREDLGGHMSARVAAAAAAEALQRWWRAETGDRNASAVYAPAVAKARARVAGQIVWDAIRRC